MFARLLLLLNLIISVLGVYLFDYKIDGVINSPLIIILSILVGTIVMVLMFLFYINLLYFLVAKRTPQDSMVKHFIAKQIMTVPLVATNIRIKLVGEENLPEDPGFSIYSNHTSLLDVPVLMYTLKKQPVAFLQKKEILNAFAIGKWTPTIGCVVIDRTNPRKGAEAIINVIRNVKKGITMVIFPEGTRTKVVGELLDFKPGSFKVALKSKAPLVPLTIVKPLNYKNVKWPFPKRITIVIHKPIPYDDLKGMSSIDLADKVKKIIEGPLKKH